ncbi:MAG TPA: tetratricopeptide repeat protein [Candidatus Binatia bacterium]
MDTQRLDSDLPEHVHDLVRRDFARLDPRLPELLDRLARHGASEIWHKHGTFLDHLLGVWRILAAWRQPRDVCLLGLMHSVYSNSFVRMKLFDSTRDGRDEVRALIGEEAERLTHLFCEIQRDELLSVAEPTNGTDGVEVSLYRTGEKVRLSRRDFATFLVVTMADFAEQHFAWQDRLFAGNPRVLWPGDSRPGLWMSLNAWLAQRAARCGAEPLPPVFESCSAQLSGEAEREARDLYWQVVRETSEGDDHERARELLQKCVRANPFIGEPHVLLAQIAIGAGRWDEALAEARAALDLLGTWGTAWDKRLGWDAWIAWARVIAKSARERAWPDSALGIVSLGEVRPAEAA